MRIESNMDGVFRLVGDVVKGLDMDSLTREIATTLMGKMRTRIHERGEAADGSQIGTYSKGYLAVRSGSFRNASKKTIKAGKTSRKDYGTHTKGANIGNKRIKYNRGNDSKVILSLTRQMESDMAIIPVENGYGIGYNNSDNFDKAMWNNKRYGKEVFSLSQEEENAAMEIVQQHLDAL